MAGGAVGGTGWRHVDDDAIDADYNKALARIRDAA